LDKNITFVAEVFFQGSMKEFEQIISALAPLPLRLRPVRRPDDAAKVQDDPDGVWTIPVARLLDNAFLSKLTQGKARCRLADNITGGIRNPHLHLKGEAVFLDRDQFKELVNLAAGEIAGRLAEQTDYCTTVSAVNRLVDSVEGLKRTE
jgi:hypothetical protein